MLITVKERTTVCDSECKEIIDDIRVIDGLIHKIEQAMKNNDDLQNLLQKASVLNKNVREKYPSVEKIVKAVYGLAAKVEINEKEDVPEPEEYMRLIEDRNAVALHIVLKKDAARRQTTH